MIRLLLILLLFSMETNAKSYYIASNGNDVNAGTITAPWKTIAKLNSFTGLVVGDQVLFNRGDIFYGAIICNKSGSSVSGITYGAYGSGADPVITGFKTVPSWNNLGGNIWESASTVSNLKAVNQVSVDGDNTPMGRFPNTGYMTFESHITNTSISSSWLTAATNWTGAEVVIRKAHWILDRCVATSQIGNKLNYTSPSTDNAQDNYGFFIQNDPRTLDVQNEWYYNPVTKKIRIYSSATPGAVKVSAIDTLVYTNQKSYITFDHLSFEGSNIATVQLYNGQNITIQNCSIDFSGGSAIMCRLVTFMKVQNNIINHSGDFGIKTELHSTDAYIGNNVIKNTGLIPGMGAAASRFTAIMSYGANTTIEYNKIDSIGFMGVNFLGSNTTIRNNFINYYCTVLDDGGGIYMYNLSNVAYSNIHVTGNIVLNGIGAPNGTANLQYSGEGIYMDNNSNGVDISNNSIANCGFAGLFIHSSYNLQINNNVVYNNNYVQIYLRNDHPNFNMPLRNVTFTGNILVAKTASQPVFLISTVSNDISQTGVFDNNYYARPINDNLTFLVDSTGTGVRINKTLAGWQSISHLDANSKKSPKTITDENDLRFEYNDGTTSKTIALNAIYSSIPGTSYNGSITLQPFTSVILIKTGTTNNINPVANAGPNQTIILQ